MLFGKLFHRRNIGRFWAVTTAACFAIARSSFAADYQGAEAVLNNALKTNAAPNGSGEKPSPRAELRADLKKFATASATLAPADAAQQWLALLDRFAKLQESPANSRPGNESDMPFSMEQVLEALPPPASWTELAKLVEARPVGEGSEALRQLGLRLLAHTLTNDAAKRQDDLTALEALAGKAKTSQAYLFNSLFEQLNRSLMASLDNPDALLQVLESKLASQQPEMGYGQLEIPDLVSLAGPEKAEAFLRKALIKSEVPLTIEAGTVTQKLAQKLALELMADLKKPQWLLVNSLDSVELYEALDKRFAKPDTGKALPTIPGLSSVPAFPRQDDYQRRQARLYYFLGLIAAGRTTNAVAVAAEFEQDGDVYFPPDVTREMERAGFTTELNTFFHDLLQKNPELPFWEEYVSVAAHAGHTAEMVELVRATLAQSGVSKGLHTRLEQLLYEALLADDEIDAGVAELRQLMQSREHQADARANYNYATLEPARLALQLARIGQLLNRTNWLEEGIAAAKAAVQAQEDHNNYFEQTTAVSLAEFLEKINRGPEAEEVLASALAKAVQNKSAQSGNFPGRQSPCTPILLALVRLYHQVGREADVLLLLDRSPNWGAKDFLEINSDYTGLDEFTSHGKHVTVPNAFYIASALAGTGRLTEANKMLDAAFNESPGSDRSYELLFKIDEQNAPARLDALFARDQFEERPLIWKAHWLRTHQQLEEAEKTARQAIAIDPSDGEEGPGDRLRAYAELAEIRAARGDQNEATTMRGAVQAIRESETADQFQEAGLLKQAVAMYNDSLTHFADAYCIHARLAVQYSDLGMHQLAEEHYRRAYELMPSSFGRVESHCFGCERAFDGQKAQNIAEEVFGKLSKETPEKPQVHYLLGYLREEQQRYKEALDGYRAAVKLDPDYLNAWIKIQGVREHVYQPAAERDSVAFNILRLDPAQRQCAASYELVTDLAGLWTHVADANAKIPIPLDSLYPLPASKLEVEKQEAQSRDQGQRFGAQFDSDEFGRNKTITPAAAVSQNGFVATAARLLGNENGQLVDE